jgi:hypothetical protein
VIAVSDSSNTDADFMTVVVETYRTFVQQRNAAIGCGVVGDEGICCWGVRGPSYRHDRVYACWNSEVERIV